MAEAPIAHDCAGDPVFIGSKLLPSRGESAHYAHVTVQKAENGLIELCPLWGTWHERILYQPRLLRDSAWKVIPDSHLSDKLTG